MQVTGLSIMISDIPMFAFLSSRLRRQQHPGFYPVDVKVCGNTADF